MFVNGPKNGFRKVTDESKMNKKMTVTFPQSSKRIGIITINFSNYTKRGLSSQSHEHVSWLVLNQH